VGSLRNKAGDRASREGIGNDRGWETVPWRILIVDDHAIVRRMLKVLVETHNGWEVCAEAENGVDALEKIRQHKPDLVIMDMAMPVKDGLSASREISALMPNVPIVMHTLHYSPELELEAKKSGVRKVVPKAESGDGLLNAIEELLDESSTQLAKRAAAAANSAELRELGAPRDEEPAAEDSDNHTRKN
jgi:DNA-binding NarL/FixJ family response regulator